MQVCVQDCHVTCPVLMVMQRMKMTAGCACAEDEVRIS